MASLDIHLVHLVFRPEGWPGSLSESGEAAVVEPELFDGLEPARRVSPEESAQIRIAHQVPVLVEHVLTESTKAVE
jgi:hypothetical protein